MNSLFKSKPKNIIAICFTAVYILTLILSIELLKFTFATNLRYAINSLVINLLPLITPSLVLIYLLSLNKEYKLKKWLFPIAFGVKALSSFVSLCFSFSSISLIALSPLYVVLQICSCLSLIAFIFMFIGTLSDFKYVNLLKYGALCSALLFFIMPIIEFIAVGGFAYLQSVPSGYSAINISVLIEVTANILFYIGIFLLTTNKNTDLRK